MCDSTGRWNSVIGFQVGVVIPHQCGNAVSAPKPALLQRFCQRTCTAVEISVGISVKGAIWQAREDVNFGKQFADALKNMDERQRIIHHRAAHAIPLTCN